MRCLLPLAVLIAAGCGGVEPPAQATRTAAVCGPSPAERPASALLGTGARGPVYGEGPAYVRFVTTPVASGRPPRVPLGRHGAIDLTVIVRPGYDGPLTMRIAPVGARLIARFERTLRSQDTLRITRTGSGVHTSGLLLPAEGCYRLLLARPGGEEPQAVYFRAT